MPEVTGVVQRKTSAMRSTRNGPVEVFSLEVGGEWYGCGFKKLPAGVEEGANISFHYEQSGNYKNLDATSVTVISGAAAPSAAGAAGPAKGNAGDDRQRVIIYQAARNAGISTFEALVRAEAIKLPTKVADKYDAAMAHITELTDRYHIDAMAVYTGELEITDPALLPSIPAEDED